MGTGDSAFGMRSDPMIPYDLMGVQSRISAQFINCPVNVPFCQRQEFSSSFGNPQQNAMDCYRIAGCCFDNNLFVYKSAFGGSFFLAPVCYRAIRTPIFHALAEQITMKTNFLPNFLVPIADKVDVFLGDENRFNLMLEYHQCLSGAKMAPSRLRLENYLTQVWPGHIWMRMRPQGDNFLEALVDTLSQTCGWDDINSRKCNGQVNIDCRGSLNQIKSCSNRACPHQFGAQPNPYGTQLNYNNYNNNNNNNQAYGSNTNSFLNQMTNRQNQGQTN